MYKSYIDLRLNIRFAYPFSKRGPVYIGMVKNSNRVACPPSRPLLIWDGECGFCRFWVQRWCRITGNTVDYVPLQSEAVYTRFPELSRAELSRSVWLIEPDGAAYSGAEAVFRSLECRRKWPLWIYLHVPGACPFFEAVYRIIADHREFFSALNKLFFRARDRG